MRPESLDGVLWTALMAFAWAYTHRVLFLILALVFVVAWGVMALVKARLTVRALQLELAIERDAHRNALDKVREFQKTIDAQQRWIEELEPGGNVRRLTPRTGHRA
jgi:hypothetical protein